MRWEQIWDRQREQQIALRENPENMSVVDKGRAVKDLVLGLYEEVSQLSQESANYKAHVLKAQPVDRSNVLGETVDIIKYAIAIAQLHGITANEAWKQFMDKSDVVAKLASGERETMEHDTKVFITDMDGCLADLGALDEVLDAVEGTPESRLMKQESIKTEFRTNGGFMDLPPIKGAPEAMRKIKAMGYKIVVITARPHHRHKRLYSDTLNWMNKHGIETDLILFERDKAEAICQYVYPARPAYFVEDRTKHAMEIAAIGVPVLLIDNEGNKETPEDELIQRVTNWGHIISHMTKNNNGESTT